jgi:CRP-like cAMP-binding protein
MGNFKSTVSSKEFVNDISRCVNAYINNYKEGSIITEFGANSKVVGIVIRGEIDIIREDELGNRTILEKLTKDCIFAEQLTYFKDDYIYVKSQTDSSIIILNYDFMLKRCARNCDNHNILISRISELLIERSNFLSQRIDILSRKNIEDKLLAYFKSLLQDKKNSNEITIPCSLSNLAEYLCVDRSNMMRELKNMEKKNIIKRNKNTIELIDYD